MINSLTELDEAIKKEQQFEKKRVDIDAWFNVDVNGYILKSLISLISKGRLRVKQIKHKGGKMADLKELLTIERDRKLISNDCKYPSAIEMIRCGIGSNYGDKYYDEVIEAVLNPIIKELKLES